jgi:F-type H+-transporting ATPase subunit a
MHDINNLGPKVIIWFDKGPLKGFYITETVFWAIIVAIFLIIVCLLSVRNLKRIPTGGQGVAELIVEYVYKFVHDNMGKHCMAFAPFIGTLFLFLLVSNALGLIGLRPVTSDMNATFGMAIVVFLVIQYNAITSGGIKHYIKHFAEPYPFMIPIKIVEEFTFPISLSFRIFGNILAGVIVMALVFSGLGYLSEEIIGLPIPLFETVIPLPLNLFFDVFEPILQAFVFSMLTMAFISKGIVVHDNSSYSTEADIISPRDLKEA